jgi:hypothetical protein
MVNRLVESRRHGNEHRKITDHENIEGKGIIADKSRQYKIKRC